MSNEQAKQVLQQGIAAARAGQQAQARQLLQEAVKRDPKSKPAWLWLSSVAKDNQERIFCLKQLLALDPNDENAIKGLRQLGVQVTAGAPPAPQAAGVPMIDEQKLSASMTQLDPILQSYQPIPTRPLPFEWTKKRRGRVGDSSAALLRIGLIAGVVIVILALVGGGVFAASKLGIAGALLSTPTPSFTPTPTVTPTPGVTDTPSPTPRSPVPSSTIPANIPQGQSSGRQPTAVYPVAGGGAVRDALQLADGGAYDPALTKLEDERKGLINVKGAEYDGVVYFEAVVYVDSGNPDRAQALLTDNKSDSAFYHAALGYVQYAQKDYDNALTQLTQALSADPNLSLAAITAAKIDTLRQKYPDALRALKISLEQQPANTLLLAARGETNLAAGNFQDALSDAQLVLYIDPLSENAYILRCEILLAQAATIQDRNARIQTYGTAVLAVKDYMVYYPSQTIAWMLLGEARQGEENTNAALMAYTQAVVADKKSMYAQKVFVSRGNLYLADHRYSDALEDFNNAIVISDTPDARNGHLQAALALKNYQAAGNDISALLKATPNNPDLLLQQANLLILTQKFSDAKAILTDNFVNGLSKDAKPIGQLYLGIVKFKTAANGKVDGVDDLNAALSARDSGLGHYYRGQAFEALKQPLDAIADYQWLEYWSKVYKYDFMDDVNTRLTNLQNSLPTQTPSPTPRGAGATATQTPSRTPTPSRTTTPSRTLPGNRRTPTVTDTPNVTDTPTDTPQPTDTPTEVSTEAATGSATAAATTAADNGANSASSTQAATSNATQAATSSGS